MFCQMYSFFIACQDVHFPLWLTLWLGGKLNMTDTNVYFLARIFYIASAKDWHSEDKLEVDLYFPSKRYQYLRAADHHDTKGLNNNKD